MAMNFVLRSKNEVEGEVDEEAWDWILVPYEMLASHALAIVAH